MLRDIGIRTEPAYNLSIVVFDRLGPRQKPAIGPIMSTQRKRIFPVRSVGKTLLDAFDDTIDMVWMMDLLPSPPSHLFQRRACIIEPAFVVPLNVPGAVSHPCKLSDVVSNGLKSFLVFTDHGFGGF